MLEVLNINGPSQPLNGKIQVSGAKNACLPLMFATLLTPKECILTNLPDLEDTSVTLRILKSFGAKYKYNNNELVIKTEKVLSTVAPYSLVKSLRASFWLMAPLLARTGKASISLPGGDAIGTRPVDLHLKGLGALGAEFYMEHGVVHGNVPGELSPAEINLEYPSVGATHNILMLASCIPGTSVIRGAAKEPEIVDMANFLRALGAEISGDGQNEITVKGTSQAKAVEHNIIGDRIEAATYLLAAAVTGGEISVTGIPPVTMQSTIELLVQMGCEANETENSITIKGPKKGSIKPIEFSTEPFPGVATDVQALFLAALNSAKGTSKVTETVFESRFGHVAEYRRFGADIVIKGKTAIINGGKELTSAPVEANDIRAAAGLILMGLMSDGVTQISGLHHLDRGYERMVEKLQSIGANILRLPMVDSREVVVGC